jgi:hypothetical protein
VGSFGGGEAKMQHDSAGMRIVKDETACRLRLFSY